ncbi:flippase-like domain-containing protein [Streptomyces sp. BR123]|uniref:lysylphosphatidylglycerol synthase transmembrane domain-containing protein n=1 Tax=Streptomyces sp. BR123 TaxID=2749828 RepID=UPI0015C4C212|nr:lysylphosphatidylglycerol synthase transmembrane domain-containing protein [Streptomyces sp. BR123]NXY93107.1 flippase-like domain-containing protein [Streptomyces sp. BR123]
MIRTLLFVAVGTGLVITLRGMDLSHLWAALKVADWRWLAVAVLANVASQVTRAVGWNAMFTEFRIRFPLLVRIEFAVQAAAAVSPEGVGEFVRIGYLSREGVARSVTVTLMMVRKFFSSLGLVPFLVLICWPGSNVPGWAVAVTWMYAALLTVLSVLVVRVARTPSAPAREGRLRKIVFDARTALGPVRRPRVFAEVGAAALVTRALDLLAAVTIAKALDLRLPTAVLVLVLLSIEVSNVLPTLPGQLGTFEAAVLGATAGTLGQAEGLALALVLHAQQVLPQIPVGTIAMGNTSISRNRSKRDAS